MTEKRNESGWLLRHPAVMGAIGVSATTVLALLVVIFLLRTGGAKAVSDNAALIGALVALGGVFTTQMVSIALDDRRTQESRNIEDRRTQETRELEDRRIQETRELEDQRAQNIALQAFLDQIAHSDTYRELRSAPASGHKRTILRAKMQTLLLQLNEERKGVLLSFLHGAKLSRKKRDNSL
jgi:hypothetical protein